MAVVYNHHLKIETETRILKIKTKQRLLTILNMNYVDHFLHSRWPLLWTFWGEIKTAFCVTHLDFVVCTLFNFAFLLVHWFTGLNSQSDCLTHWPMPTVWNTLQKLSWQTLNESLILAVDRRLAWCVIAFICWIFNHFWNLKLDILKNY